MRFPECQTHGIETVYALVHMDALLTATRLPRISERTIRRAIAATIARKNLTPRALIDGALLNFERAIARVAADGIRPAMLFAERDRIVRDLNAFMRSRLAVRLAALRPHDLLARGVSARPFDALITGRRGGTYALVIRNLGEGPRRLTTLTAIRNAAVAASVELRGIVIYDLATAKILNVALRQATTRQAA